MEEPVSTIKVKTRLPRKKAEALKTKGMISRIRRAHEHQIELTSPTEFFKKFSTPVESRLYRWMETVRTTTEEQLDTQGYSRIVEVDPSSGKWRWRIIQSSQQLREIMGTNQNSYDIFMKLREQAYIKNIKAMEDDFDSSDLITNSVGAFDVRPQFVPLIGTPFYKQLYLTDYWEMHSKCFWFSNYSGIAKLIVDMTRNFVMGKGFNVSFDDEKCDDIWKAYEDRSNIQEESRNWCDDLTKFGENMLKKIPGPKGIIHKAIDPSTIWEIVTDPENISDVKYYHQQYNTQYQIFGDGTTPLSKYIINQLPPSLMLHTKVNVTSYEKRGRADLLAPLLYFKYYEDYIQAKLLRAKAEAAFIWDVEIDGSDEDVSAYINSTESIVDVPPGSENVHNKAIKRTPLSPSLSSNRGGDVVAQDILSYVAMSVSIPADYMGTFGTGGSTKAGALVKTEPVAKKMMERQFKMENLIRRVVKDVLIDAGKDPSTKFEVNFPEFFDEDRSAKIQDLILSKDENFISHQTAAEIVSKELKITRYDYDSEMKKIKDEQGNPLFNPPPPDLTPGMNDGETGMDRAVDRPKIRQQGTEF